MPGSYSPPFGVLLPEAPRDRESVDLCVRGRRAVSFDFGLDDAETPRRTYQLTFSKVNRRGATYGYHCWRSVLVPILSSSFRLRGGWGDVVCG